MVSHLTFLALEALLPAVVLVVVTGLLLRFAWKERRGQRVLLLEVFVLFLFGSHAVGFHDTCDSLCLCALFFFLNCCCITLFK